MQCYPCNRHPSGARPHTWHLNNTTYIDVSKVITSFEAIYYVGSWRQHIHQKYKIEPKACHQFSPTASNKDSYFLLLLPNYMEILNDKSNLSRKMRRQINLQLDRNKSQGCCLCPVSDINVVQSIILIQHGFGQSSMRGFGAEKLISDKSWHVEAETKLVITFQRFWNAFSWKKIIAHGFKFHWSLFLRIPLTMK